MANASTLVLVADEGRDDDDAAIDVYHLILESTALLRRIFGAVLSAAAGVSYKRGRKALVASISDGE